MSADNMQDPSQSNDNTNQTSGNKDAVAETMSQIQEQLRTLNEQMTAQSQVIQSRMTNAHQEQETDDNLYEPQTLLRKAGDIMDSRLREERAKDAKIYELSQEYPEIKTDAKLRTSILEAQKSLPTSIRDTADGYEMAVLKAVSKTGLVPKSKRRDVEEDISMGSGGDGMGSVRRNTNKKVKLSEETLMAAQLMGRDINDPEVIKRLEAAASRDTFNKYR